MDREYGWLQYFGVTELDTTEHAHAHTHTQRAQ